MTNPGVVVLLTLLFGIQPVTTDLYLPALPTLRHELGASIAAAKFTLSALIICLAGVHSVWAIVLPQYLYAIGHGIGAFGAVAWTLVQRHGEPVPATRVLVETQAA